MNDNTQIQKYSSLSLTKVQNRLSITNKLFAATHVELQKNNFTNKIDTSPSLTYIWQKKF